VQSFAKPGGNVTGFINMEPTMARKWLELLKEIAPRVNRVAFLFNPATAPYFDYYLNPFEAAASSFGVEAIAMMGELGRGSQGGDRLLDELEPLDRPKHDDRVPGVPNCDRPVRPGEHKPYPRDLSVKPDHPPLEPPPPSQWQALVHLGKHAVMPRDGLESYFSAPGLTNSRCRGPAFSIESRVSRQVEA
jgi:hypothetical protein